MCYHKKDVSAMEEQEQEVQPERYVPRPRWQVCAARIALVVFLIGLVLYYCNIYGVAR